MLRAGTAVTRSSSERWESIRRSISVSDRRGREVVSVLGLMGRKCINNVLRLN